MPHLHIVIDGAIMLIAKDLSRLITLKGAQSYFFNFFQTSEDFAITRKLIFLITCVKFYGWNVFCLEYINENMPGYGNHKLSLRSNVIISKFWKIGLYTFNYSFNWCYCALRYTFVYVSASDLNKCYYYYTIGN